MQKENALLACVQCKEIKYKQLSILKLRSRSKNSGLLKISRNQNCPLCTQDIGTCFLKVRSGYAQDLRNKWKTAGLKANKTPPKQTWPFHHVQSQLYPIQLRAFVSGSRTPKTRKLLAFINGRVDDIISCTCILYFREKYCFIRSCGSFCRRMHD